MENKQNYYQILHVQPDAPREIIRSSYRTMMQRMRMHPDLGGDDTSAANINEAYAILANPRNRAAYDRARLASEQTSQSGKTATAATHQASNPGHACAFCGTPHEHGKKIQADALCSDCRSPLVLPEQSPMEEHSRRKILRLPHEHPLSFYTHWPQGDAYTGRTIDISLSGMKFDSDTGLEIGQLIKIDCQILKAVARVLHSHQEGDKGEVGVHFLRLCFAQSRGSFVSVHA